MGGYIGSNIGTIANAAERKQTYSITTATTSLTGLAYTPTKVHVFHNGVRLVDGTDYTATNGTSITLTNAAQNGDEVVVISYPSFQTSDTVSAANGGTFAGNVEHTGTLTTSSDLNAGTIKNASGTNTAMTIDTNGVVSTPARPAFSAYKDSTTSEGLTGTIVFNGTRSNVGNHYSTTTGKFTAPIAGLYQFNFVGFGVGDTSASYLSANTSVYVTLYNETTSTNLVRSYGQDSVNHYPNMSFSGMVPLAANDVIRIDVGNNYIYSDGSDVYLTFSGFLVG